MNILNTEPPPERPITMSAEIVRGDLLKTVQAGANWFYWIAGLSAVNSFARFMGSTWRFVIGLGLTEVVDGIAAGMNAGGGVVNLALDLMIVGMFVLFGMKSGNRSKGAFLTGMIVYTLDGVLCVLGEDYFSAAFHGLALYYIFRGFSANNELRAAEAAAAPPELTQVNTN